MLGAPRLLENPLVLVVVDELVHNFSPVHQITTVGQFFPFLLTPTIAVALSTLNQFASLSVVWTQL